MKAFDSPAAISGGGDGERNLREGREGHCTYVEGMQLTLICGCEDFPARLYQ